MTYIIKIGNQYLTADGSFSDRQADALPFGADHASDVRIVKLRPRQHVRDDDHDPDDRY